ncbi:hypothetical protein IE53DRAFT_363747 [Violaceomyces palustris]|uniref:Uncharacterized protein n=1 Tax=Violaceomyces palustris TaxID=1673888 RepID=A0ACD0NS46_9BASI|nr:hypothetical protein IE53DRAFT_363747 [Violaceomyces palustris]
MSSKKNELSDLSKLVSKKYSLAIDSGDAFYYPSTITKIEDHTSGSKIVWQIRTVPALLKKPKAEEGEQAKPASGDDSKNKAAPQSRQNPTDVFAPPYVPNLHVKDLDDHVVLLNKFCVVPEHFLLVTKEFQPQQSPPPPSSLALVYRIINSHRSRNGESELLGFYNCGQLSGASQPHRHFQFIQLPPPRDGSVEEEEEQEQEEEEEDEEQVRVPIEVLLEKIEKDGKEEEHVHALPVPWQHFVVLLNPPKSKSSDPSSSSVLEQYMANKFMSLLDALFRARMVAQHERDEKGEKPRPSGPPSFNILITKRAMHLIPRSKEEFDELPRIEGEDQSTIGNLSLNALCFAGFLLTKSQAEVEALQKLKGGVPEVLAKVGIEPVPDVTVAQGNPKDEDANL